MPFPTERRFIAKAEEALGRRLPSSYVARMLQSNGGSVEVEGDEWVLHPIFDDSDQKRLKRTFNDIIRETRSAGEWRGFPSDAVVIAANGFGDHLVLLPGTGDDRFGDTVYIWEHEWSASSTGREIQVRCHCRVASADPGIVPDVAWR